MQTPAVADRQQPDRCPQCGQEDVDGVRWVDMVDQCVADTCPVRDETFDPDQLIGPDDILPFGGDQMRAVVNAQQDRRGGGDRRD